MVKFDEETKAWWVRDPVNTEIWEWCLSEKFLLWVTPIISMTVIVPEVTFISNDPDESFRGASYNTLRKDVGMSTLRLDREVRQQSLSLEALYDWEPKEDSYMTP